MSSLKNFDENVEFNIVLNKVIECGKTPYETWVSSQLSIKSNTINITLGTEIDFALNMYEIDDFGKKMEKLYDCCKNLDNGNINFSNIEYNFELKIECLPEDEAIETELWINTAARTNGKVFGYEEGIRFASSFIEFKKFYHEYKNNCEYIKNKTCNYVF